MNVTCVVNETPGPPDFIFWYHNGDVSVVFAIIKSLLTVIAP